MVKYPKLYELALNNNRIADFNWTRFMKRNRVAVLWLRGNPIASEQDYRDRIFKALGLDLDVLDGVDRAGKDVSEI